MKPLSSIAPLAALFLLSDPFAAVLAEQRHVTKYQPGFTEEAACYRYEYREEYVPGNSQSKGYVKSHRDKVEVSCGNSNEVGTSDHNYNQQQARNNDVHLAHHGQQPQPQIINVYPARQVQQAAQVPQGDTNDCRSGTVLGAIAGGAGAFGLTNGGRYSNDHLWSVPLGMVAGSMAGCQLNGG